MHNTHSLFSLLLFLWGNLIIICFASSAAFSHSSNQSAALCEIVRWVTSAVFLKAVYSLSVPAVVGTKADFSPLLWKYSKKLFGVPPYVSEVRIAFCWPWPWWPLDFYNGYSLTSIWRHLHSRLKEEEVFSRFFRSTVDHASRWLKV